MSRRALPALAAALAATLFVAGCAAADDDAGSSPEPTNGSSPSESATAAPTSSPARTDLARPIRIDVAQSGGVVTPPPSRVEVPLGSAVVLRVGSDVADEIHVHGYELEQDVAAGGTTTFEFTADQSGLFEVETHETELLLLQLQVA